MGCFRGRYEGTAFALPNLRIRTGIDHEFSTALLHRFASRGQPRRPVGRCQWAGGVRDGSWGDIDLVLGRAGVNPESLRQPTLSLPLTNYCQVLEEAARQSHCDNFGLHYGLQFQPQALGLLGYVGLFSSTLEEALRNFAAAFPYHQHDTLIRLADCGECYRFDYQVRHSAIWSAGRMPN